MMKMEIYYLKECPIMKLSFWADADHTILDAVIRFYEIMEIEQMEIEITSQKIEYYTPLRSLVL